MITFQRLARCVSAEPFRPFRISMTTGKSIEIRDPEMISVGRFKVRICTFWSEDPEDAMNPEYEVLLDLIESVEPLEGPLNSNSKEQHCLD